MCCIKSVTWSLQAAQSFPGCPCNSTAAPKRPLAITISGRTREAAGGLLEVRERLFLYLVSRPGSPNRSNQIWTILKGSAEPSNSTQSFQARKGRQDAAAASYAPLLGLNCPPHCPPPVQCCHLPAFPLSPQLRLFKGIILY